MKKILFSTLVMASVLASCNQKNKETTTDNSHMMDNDSTMMDNDSTMMSNDSTMMNDKTKMMNNQAKMYACPMHPEVQGKLNDKCPKCGMKLTEPVPEKKEENK
jgi:nitrous oxide reductase accessory protein NosL